MIGNVQETDHTLNHLSELIATVEGMNAPSGQDQQGMSESELAIIIGQHMQTGQQWFGTGKLASQRLKADQYYRGDPLGNEIDGRSQVVSRDVAEAIDSMMPSLIRVFASGDQVVIMEPSRPDAEEAAKQATDYINWQFLQQNEGFQVLYTWFKDALLKRTGIVMAYYETRTTRQKDTYEGLTEAQWQAIQQDPSVMVVKTESYPDDSQPPMPMIDPMTGQPAIDPMTGQPHMQPPAMLYNCTLMNAKPVKKLVVQNVPPDEYVIERRAISLDSANFHARRRRVTISDLIELGFDPEKVKNIPDNNGQDFSQEKTERFNDEDQMPYDNHGELDPTMRKVWVTEAYLRVDFDGDGIAEWRKVTIAGDSDISGTTLLDNEEIDDHPFAALTPIPDPHRFYGYGVYDQVKDIQDIKTTLWRGGLDSIYLANSPRTGVVEGQVNLDDLLDSRVGGIVRMKSPNAIVPLPTVMASPQAFEMLEYMDSVREQRIGVPRMNPGLDPDTLNKTATGAKLMADGAQQRLELIARIFAETGVKRLFRRIFELTCQHEDKAQTVRLRGKWIDVDPRDWKGRMDVTVSVGVGLGNRAEKMAQAMAILNIQHQIVQLQQGIQGPMVTGKDIYNVLGKIIEASGWKTIEPYFSNPDTTPPPPPKPDPEMMKLQAEHQNEMALEQAKITVAQMTNAAQAEGDKIRIQYEAAKDIEIARMDNETKIVVAQIAAQSDIQSAAVGKEDAPISIDSTGTVVHRPGMGELINTITSQLRETFAGVQVGLDSVHQSHKAMVDALNKPKKFIHDDQGNIVGAE